MLQTMCWVSSTESASARRSQPLIEPVLVHTHASSMAKEQTRQLSSHEQASKSQLVLLQRRTTSSSWYRRPDA